VMILLRGTSVVLAVALLSACAARKPRTAGAVVPPAGQETASAASARGALSEFMEKVRHLSANARPSPASARASTLEGSDPALAAALILVKASPTAERHRNLAEMYRERGVLDAAYRHYNRALALNSRDAGAYEGLARIWRDWGMPHLAVGDAHRATFYAPHSASAQNTFGTIMQALGRFADARSAYELASWLDPQAAYPANNLCYLSFLQGRIDAAVDACTVALKLDPSLSAARNNLALAYAAAGRMDLARTYFLEGDRASGLYNTGIAYLAAGDDQNALAAFDAASRARPTLSIARERAEQIRARLFRSTHVIERTAGAPGR
jgi:tetratricopeptide (TPR) repeat protein